MSFEDEILKLARRSSANSESYGLWGKEAAKRYIEDGTSLSDHIAKTASEHGLNPDEIARVVEAANLEVFDHKLKTASTKAFEFDVADHGKVIRSLGVPKQKTAMPEVFFTDYDKPLSQDLSKTAGKDIFTAFQVEEGEEKVASLRMAGDLLERLEFARQDLRYKIAYNVEKFVECSEGFYDKVKQEVLAGKSFTDISNALMSKAEEGQQADRVRELLGWAKRKLVDSGVMLSAARHGDADVEPEEEKKEKKAEPVESALISDTFESPGVPVHVVNGRHPLFATLNTLVQQFDEADKNNYNLIILEDKIRYVKRRVGGQNEDL